MDLDAFKPFILGNNKNGPRLTNVIYKNMEARIAVALLYLVKGHKVEELNKKQLEQIARFW